MGKRVQCLGRAVVAVVAVIAAAAVVAMASAPRAPSSTAAMHKARLSLVATVSGRYGIYSPWSPTAPLLAYSDDGGVVVLDVTQSPPSPLRVLPGIDADCTWSPDGRWLLARTPPRARDAQGAALVAIPARGGSEIVVVDNILVSDFTWAADGKIYYWDYEATKAHVIAAPAVWARQNPGPFVSRPILVFAFGSGAPAAHVFDVRDGVVTMRLVPALAGRPRSILRADGFSDGRLLVHESAATDDGPGINHVFDSGGRDTTPLLPTVGGGAFAATSVSGDGLFVAGERIDDTGDGIVSASLYLVAVDGAWTARVEGVEWGTQPRLSRVGSWLAFTDAEGRAHVGALERPATPRRP
jgi:hypothetical protein